MALFPQDKTLDMVLQDQRAWTFYDSCGPDAFQRFQIYIVIGSTGLY